MANLPIVEWQSRARAHALRADGWIQGRRDRKARGQREPVLDFLFDYYPYSPAKIKTWFPGVGNTVEIDDDNSLPHPTWVVQGGTQILDPQYAERNRRRLDFVIQLLSSTAERAAMFNCFGAHEWAMVYRASPDDIRHPDPLRLPLSEIDKTVEALGLRCTHIDAYRFFTDAAVPLNHNAQDLIPTRENQPALEQKGCLHANMDLYKYCMWFQPAVSGELLLDCFELALTARTLDMQASPYDLSAFGYSAITIETPDGRAEYTRVQKEISVSADLLRDRLLQQLRAALEHKVPVQIR